MARRRDPYTKDLFAWEPEPVRIAYADEVTGRGNMDSQISRVIGQALRDAKDNGVSRMEIAGRMASYLNRPITDDALNKWASEATDDRRIPLDAFIALAHATDSHELVGFVAGLFDLAVVPDRFVELIEMHQLEEHKREVDARIAALQAKSRGRG
ncbi:MAG: hypothetical protein VYB05_20550 [Pseudomonadota bacterium]|nr:hypothetical protein [Pseudomonadota bacterium]